MSAAFSNVYVTFFGGIASHTLWCIISKEGTPISFHTFEGLLYANVDAESIRWQIWMPWNHLSNVGEVKKDFESKTCIHTSTLILQSLPGNLCSKGKNWGCKFLVKCPFMLYSILSFSLLSFFASVENWHTWISICRKRKKKIQTVHPMNCMTVRLKYMRVA